MPPSQNPTYIKIDEDSFYLATTSSTALSASNIQNQITQHQSFISLLTAQLQSAAQAGVSSAQTILNGLQK